jgi:hypothetical protein
VQIYPSWLYVRKGHDLSREFITAGATIDPGKKDTKIHAASLMNVILYDTADRRAWLVDVANALLHLIVILNTRFSNIDQCYFDFHPTTGELILQDISKNDGELNKYSDNENNFLTGICHPVGIIYSKEMSSNCAPSTSNSPPIIP